MTRAVVAVASLLLLLGVGRAAESTADDAGFFDAAAGRWHLPAAGGTASFYFGDPGDVAFVGDWDCDGVDTPGLYRRADGFVYLTDQNRSGTAERSFFFGQSGDVPLAGDFDGDGCDTVSVFRQGSVFIRNSLTTGVAELAYAFGNPGDVPFVGDVDGDGVDEVGLHRAATGFVYFRFTHTSGVADHRFFYGVGGDRLFAGDFNGDGTDTVGIFRPQDRHLYLRHSNTQGPADEVISAGRMGWIPVAGSFGDLEATAVPLEVIEQAAWSDAATGPFRPHEIDHITFHHAAVALADNRLAPAHFRSYQRFHQQAGWPDIAYHLLIDREGNVYEGRPLWARGDTFTEYDPTGHFLALLDGDFDEQEPTAVQLEVLAQVLAWGAQQYRVDPAEIDGHRHYAATSCPGDNLYVHLPWLRQRVDEILAGGGVDLSYLRGAEAKQRVAAVEGGAAPTSRVRDGHAPPG